MQWRYGRNHSGTPHAVDGLAGAAAARAVHIVAFGDSATAGYLVPRGQAYPAQLQARCAPRAMTSSSPMPASTATPRPARSHRFDPAIGARHRHRHRRIRHQRSAPRRLRQGIARQSQRNRPHVAQARHRGAGHRARQLDLADVASANGVPYAQWNLPPGKYRARDGRTSMPKAMPSSSRACCRRSKPDCTGVRRVH